MDSQKRHMPSTLTPALLSPTGPELLSQKLPLSCTHPIPDLCNTPVCVRGVRRGACLMKGNSTHPEPSCLQLVFKEVSQGDWCSFHPPCRVPLKVNQRQSCQLPFTHTHALPSESASARLGSQANCDRDHRLGTS